MASADMQYDLERFVAAQDSVYARVQTELAAGRKSSHWMWFIFPQLRGLGRSATAEHFALENLQEAKAYLAHPILGSRLRDCTRRVLAVSGSDARAIFGSPDDLKFRSSMTLFAAASPSEPLFADALDRLCAGVKDPLTTEMLRAPRC